MKRRIGALLGVAAFWLMATAQAQVSSGQYTWEEFSKRITASAAVSPLEPDFSGELVQLSNGALSFSVTDISIPGNDDLPVEFVRNYSVFNRKDYGDLGMLGDWTVGVPSISAVFAPDWLLGYAKTADRCTTDGVPSQAFPFDVTDFWQGLQIDLPGGAGGELLRVNEKTVRPQDGKEYRWTTSSHVLISCLPTIKNGNGEGFLAITPDGTRYWFDWMGQTHETASRTTITYPDGGKLNHYLTRKKNFLYVTRVEDRHGNYVAYTYGNGWNSPGRLTKIQASDGRELNFIYSGDVISAINEGDRTWRYEYETTAGGRKTLTRVVLPDASSWKINFAGITDAIIKQYEFVPIGEIMRTCTENAVPLNNDEEFTASVVHPSGALTSYVLDIEEHGRSLVPVNCRNVVLTAPSYSPLSNDKNDDQNIYSTAAYSLTLKEKSVSGPGLETVTWNYSYASNHSVLFYQGATYDYPVCDFKTHDCALPPCVSDDCAINSRTTVMRSDGVWVKYLHGNTYRYNEGKLLKMETGIGSSVSESVEYTYDLSMRDKIYPARNGYSKRWGGDGFSSEYHRPLIKTETIRDGMKFIWMVQEFDSFARPVRVLNASMPVP